jgi:predicted DNA-binding protein
MTQERKMYSFRLPEHLRKRLNETARKRGLSASAVIIESLSKNLLADENEPSDASIIAACKDSKARFAAIDNGQYERSSILDTLREEGLI